MIFFFTVSMDGREYIFICQFLHHPPNIQKQLLSASHCQGKYQDFIQRLTWILGLLKGLRIFGQIHRLLGVEEIGNDLNLE